MCRCGSCLISGKRRAAEGGERPTIRGTRELKE
jgi:hypothetical protein